MDERSLDAVLSAVSVGLLWAASTAFLPGPPGRLSGLVAVVLAGLAAHSVVTERVGALGWTTVVVYVSLLCLSVAAGLVEQVVAVDVSRVLGNGLTAVAFGAYVAVVYAVSPRVRGWASHGRGSSSS